MGELLGGRPEPFVETLHGLAPGLLDGEGVLVLGGALLPVVDGEQHDPTEPGDHGEGDLQQVEQLIDAEHPGSRQPRPAQEPERPPPVPATTPAMTSHSSTKSETSPLTRGSSGS